jgi:two-component system, chemotaxis family, chemotaxis protein CheY
METNMTKKTVLVVDDSSTVRQQVSLTLAEAGYDVTEAVDGVEALAAVRAQPPALVLCDVNMPRMTGLEFLETLKGDEPGPPLPVVMLTSGGMPELISRAKRAGARGWIVKPFRPNLLVAAVKRLVGDPA